MGEVWRARDSRLAREVAIKVLPSELAADQERLKRFEKEARSASSLNHPSIVTIYEVGQAESVSYIAMELVEGKTLRELLLSGPLSIKRLLQIGTQVADGLARAHEAGIVHRDLKPENVMVTKDGLAKILDFGLAKLTHAGPGSGDQTNLPTQTATTPGVVMGTVGYMSPEQATGNPVDYRSDQFSLGSLLYEMATGTKAFQRKTAVETLSAIIRDEPEPVGTANSQVPPPLRWVIERCLAKDPEERYASTRDLARELATVRDHLSEAFSSGQVAGVAPRRRVSAAAAAVGLGLLALGLLAGKLVWRPPAASPLRFHQLTFRRGNVGHARFAPDGQTVVYSAIWQDRPAELFTARVEAPESRALGLEHADIFSVSSSGEMAVELVDESGGKTLAVAALSGGAPRKLLENVGLADWAPDGKNLAVVHVVRNKSRLEFPPGKVLYEAPYIGGLCFSPKGNAIAFVKGQGAGGTLAVVDLAGHRRELTTAPYECRWSPAGDEIWFNVVAGGTTEIRGITLEGRQRRIASLPGDFVFHDVSREGRLLVERSTQTFEILGLAPGEQRERNLSWLDRSDAVDLSADGGTLLIWEGGAGGGENGAVYLRKTDGSPAVRLGEGKPTALSPDGRWALSIRPGPPAQIVMLPTGTGQPKPLPPGRVNVSAGYWAEFHPDGRRVLFLGDEPGRGSRFYMQDADGGEPRPITAEGIEIGVSWRRFHHVVSPDGKWLVAAPIGGKLSLFPLEGGELRPIPGVSEGDIPIQWSLDGRSLFVRAGQLHPARVFRLDLSSGRRELWREFASAGPPTESIVSILLAGDGKSRVYSHQRIFSELYLVEGLRQP